MPLAFFFFFFLVLMNSSSFYWHFATRKCFTLDTIRVQLCKSWRKWAIISIIGSIKGCGGEKSVPRLFAREHNFLLYICSKAAQSATPASPVSYIFHRASFGKYFITYYHTYMDLWTYSTAIIWLASLYDDTRDTSLHTFDYFNKNGWA